MAKGSPSLTVRWGRESKQKDMAGEKLRNRWRDYNIIIDLHTGHFEAYELQGVVDRKRPRASYRGW